MPTASLTAVFFLSGACSLVYQVVWSRLLALRLGNTNEAQTVVIACFMGGLALGYAVLGGVGDRARGPLRTYGVLEVGITAWAAASPWLVNVLGAGVSSAWVLAALVLVPPTMLMGGTLPILAAAITRSTRSDPGAVVARLYAVNSFGAVAGVLGSGFFALEAVGLRATLWGACAANAGLAILVLSLASRPATAPTAAGKDPLPPAAPWSPWPAIAAAVFGYVSLALEGLWIRIFSVIMGSSTYSFSLVIGAFITGIGLGSALVRGPLRRVPALPALAGCAWLAALSLWATGALYERLPWWLAGLKVALSTHDSGFELWSLARFGTVFALVLVPAAAFGAALPLAARDAARVRPGGGTGALFALNTVGAVLGVATCVPWLVPWLGLDGVFTGATVVLGLLAAVLTGACAPPPRAAAMAVAALVAVGMGLAAPQWDARVIGAGAFRARKAPAAEFDAWRARLTASDVVFAADGPNASVAVLEREGDRVLVVNGKPDASTRGDMLTQVASAHIPLLLHPQPRRALVVGLGSGVTVGSAALHPDLQVDVVEISSSVVAASDAFRSVHEGALERANVTLVVDDARTVLTEAAAGVESRWDVIISEPSNPWVAGNAGLFSVEFFELVSASLRDGGHLAQWIHLYETDDDMVRMVIRSLRSVFPHVELWLLYPTDLLMVAGAAPMEVALGALTERATAPPIAADLARVGIEDVSGLLALQVSGPPGVAELLRLVGPLNTDDHPLLEFEAPRRLFTARRAQLLSSIDRRRDIRQLPRELRLSRLLAQWPLTPAAAEALFVSHTTYPGSPASFRLSLVPGMLARSGEEFLVNLLFTLDREGHSDEAEQTERRLLEIAAETPRALYAVAQSRHHRAGADVTGLLERCVQLGDDRHGRCARLRRTLASE